MADDFDVWLGTLPKWLQTAAADLVSRQKAPDAAGIGKLADLVVAEEEGTAASFSTVPAGSFSAPAAGVPTQLRRIEIVGGVNALASGAALDFGDASLVAIYGHNGSGKSGFARITKDAAENRARSTILSNVFQTPGATPSADFSYERGGSPQTSRWTQGGGPVPQLKSLHVFDSDIARSYFSVKGEEATYEPRRMRFLTSLVTICDQVRDELEVRKSRLPSALPAVPADVATSKLAGFLRDMKHSLTPEAVTAKFTWTAGSADELRIRQEALAAPDPGIRLGQIEISLSAHDRLATQLVRLQSTFAQEEIASITGAAAAAREARRLADQLAATTFEKARLPGVGGAAWKAMWAAARTYATEVAHPGHTFPGAAGSACPLCQQDTDGETTDRLQRFDAFVSGEIEAQARSAEKTHAELVKKLPVLPDESDWVLRFAEVPDAAPHARASHRAMTATLGTLGTATSASVVPSVDLTALSARVSAFREQLQAEKVIVERVKEEAGRAKLVEELRELRMQQWGHENLVAVLAELARRKSVAVLDGAIRRTLTRGITTKKNELAEHELTGGYQDRFQAELKALGGTRLRVKPVEASKAKGVIKFRLAIDGAVDPTVSAADVLSEGEARIVALAAFFADVTVAGARTPFLFDDPISSLDVEFEERVVKRLFELARTRQVLVFTHRLSLVTLLRDAYDQHRKAAEETATPIDVRFAQIRLSRLGAYVGLATPPTEKEQKVHAGADTIATQRIADAKAHLSAGRVSEYEQTMKAICSDLRILTERAVEEVLLDEIVKRFRRSVMTKDKLPKLTKVTASDCALLDDLMTRLSAFEHSQPDELPSTLPDMDVVRVDAERLRDWAREFSKRKLPAAVPP